MLTKLHIDSLNSELNDSIVKQEPLHGGDINSCYKITCASGKVYAIKTNSASKFPDMFKREKEGLELLTSVSGVTTPCVISTFDADETSFLVLEYIDEQHENPNAVFGEILAKMHAQNVGSYGLQNNNYIGSLIQVNDFETSWHEFYSKHRLIHMFKLAFDKYQLSDNSAKQLERLCNRLNEIFPPSKPSLLHGDLWNGNVLHNAQNGWFLIDPAVYYGHPEMDLGMMKLFGGFSDECYQAYMIHGKVEPDWQSRLEFTQLYPLLVHLNLFGMSYWSSIESTLSRF